MAGPWEPMFPDGPVVKNLPVNAGNMGWFLLGELRSQCHRATKPCVSQEKPLQWEACTLQLESSPHSPQLKKPMCSNEDPVLPKINKQINLFKN